MDQLLKVIHPALQLDVGVPQSLNYLVVQFNLLYLKLQFLDSRFEELETDSLILVRSPETRRGIR
jgi:hypothetical protein